MTIAQAVRPERARIVPAFGEARTIREWSHSAQVSLSVLRRRMRVFHPEVALTLPVQSHADPDAEPGAPGSWTWELLRYEDDPWARRFVAQHPEGATLEEVGAALGVVREAVRKIEEAALEKVRAAASELGLSIEQFTAGLSERPARRVSALSRLLSDP